MRPRKPDGNWPNRPADLVALRSVLRLRNSCPQPAGAMDQYITPTRVEPASRSAPSRLRNAKPPPSPVANRSCNAAVHPAWRRRKGRPSSVTSRLENGDRSPGGLGRFHRYRGDVHPNPSPRADRIDNLACRWESGMLVMAPPYRFRWTAGRRRHLCRARGQVARVSHERTARSNVRRRSPSRVLCPSGVRRR